MHQCLSTKSVQSHITVLLHERSVPRPVPIPPVPPIVPSFPYDVFLSHPWAEDEVGRNTHERVKLVKEALEARGISAWFDEEQMQGDIYHRMARGIQASLTVGNNISIVGISISARCGNRGACS